MKRIIAVALLFALLCAAPAQSRILLKPKDGAALPLRLKAIEAKIEIEKQFATTVTQMTFQNEVSDRIEADFIYTVPPRSVVTYFAYWYEKEKVVARVVEKERAASIYQHITSRMRDPALIELIGKDTFRARIFPIMPDADLRVEIHTVETLASTPNGARYSFALKPEEKGTGTLENLDICVRVKRDADLLGAGNNLALPVATENSAWTMHLSQKNFRPTQDLNIGLKWKPQNLQAKLLAAPSGGSDGFFALAITPSRNIAKPQLKIGGVKTYGVLPRRLTNLKAGQTTVVVGRYRGGGAARITCAGQTSTVEFSRTRRDNNAATKFWAAQQIEVSSQNAKHRGRVVSLSKRFTLPSKYTSWLAIPEAERRRYKEEKAYAELDAATRRYMREVEAGRGTSRLAKEQRALVDESERVLGSQGRGYLKEVARQRLQEIAYAHARSKYGDGANEIERSPRSATRWRQRAMRLAPVAGTLSSRVLQQAEREFIAPRMAVAAVRVADLEKSVRPNLSHLRRFREELKGLERASGLSAKPYLKQARSDAAGKRLVDVSERLADGIYKGEEATSETQRVNEKFGSLLRQTQRDYRDRTTGESYWELERRPTEAYAARAHLAADAIVREKKKATPDTAKIAGLQKDLARLAKASGRAPQDVLDWHTKGYQVEWLDKQTPEQIRKTYGRDYYLRQGDPLISIDAPADAQQVVAILPNGEVKQLVFDSTSKRWLARFDVPTYAAEGDYTIEIVIVDKDGARRRFTLTYQVDMTVPRGEALAQRAQNGALRLEVQGDAGTARVAALLPSGEKAELQPSATDKTRFIAHVDMKHNEQALQTVTYILTDRAHNRTQISVDLSK